MKKLTANLLIASTILGSIAAPTVKAEEGEVQPSATEVETKANVKFEANDEGETKPVDPVEPGNPTDPTDPENPGGQGGGDKGALRIDWAPHFNFGENKIEGGKEFVIPATHYKNKEGNPIHYFVQVSDLRGLDDANWQLNVTASPLARTESAETKEDDQKNQLLGSYITFTPGNVLNDGVTSEDGVKFKVENDGKGQFALDNNIKTLIDAKNDQNPQGTWSFAMESSSQPREDEDRTQDVTLTIPASQVKKIRQATYQATLKWELSSTVKSDTKGLLPVAK
ncbi:WxL domain-containing protein [Vagococcus lutrae]|uniref:WxL domain-containing protein n=1 Tax=Vagococcus lutrae TaxID=81947 RepID=UPI00200E8BAE|nr:WxL domain-containing protein [Vagococcus lutrae]MDT2805985.1 WxL domain-containing protein [Vagococcus lutrae]MDT2823421.1 WxL domain-containing protein [Vagococcus lutrae]UQF18535.1 WxL domain-containing protein [Vagococcus lutrae]